MIGDKAHVRVRLGEATLARYREPNKCVAIAKELVVRWDGWISPCHNVEPRPSESDYDNVFRKSLGEVLELSPFLGQCRLEQRRTSTCGCDEGCLAQRAINFLN